MIRPLLVFLVGVVSVAGCDGCSIPGANHGEGEGEGEGEPGRVLVIEPADQTLTATVGGTETLALSAFFVEGGVRTAATEVFWASLDAPVGVIDQSGVFSPTRERAGDGRVRAKASDLEATAVVHVVLNEDFIVPGSASNPADFSGPAAASPGSPLLYPADGVVIPANLAPMVFQWDKRQPRARLRLVGAHGSLTLYGDSNEMTAPTASWRRFLVSHAGQGASFSVSLEESSGPGAEVFTSTIAVNLADADLTSTVYYWAVNVGRVVRIDADSLAPIELAIPFEDNASAANSETQCRGCHSLSASGQHMSFTYFGGGGPGGVVNTTNVAEPLLKNQDDKRWNFSALSPDGSLLLTNLNHRLSLRDGTTGGVLDGDASDGQDAAHPAMSPAGDAVAFAQVTQRYVDANGFSWEVDFSGSDIHVASLDPINRLLGASRRLVPGNGRALYYPAFSPDGSLLTYTEGPHSRSSFNGNLPGDLWLAQATDTSGDAPRVRLDRANPDHNSYLPTFNPKVEGGYMWVAFFSRRDYGHHIRGEQRPQIWVAAVDAGADPSLALDPSHPGFWLPGQVEDTTNLSSFFAPKPCSDAGGGCGSDDGCCQNLLCRPVNGVDQCVPADQACTLPGDVCTDNCCDGAGACVDDGTGSRRCLTSTCAAVGEACDDARTCCEGFCAENLCAVIGG